MLGAVRSSGVPVNSSAPTSGVVALRVLPSKSSVIPETGVPPLSSWVATPGFICKKFAFAPAVLRNGGFSEKEFESREATLVLYAEIVTSVLVPSVKIVEPKKSLLFEAAA